MSAEVTSQDVGAGAFNRTAAFRTGGAVLLLGLIAVGVALFVIAREPVSEACQGEVNTASNWIWVSFLISVCTIVLALLAAIGAGVFAQHDLARKYAPGYFRGEGSWLPWKKRAAMASRS